MDEDYININPPITEEKIEEFINLEDKTPIRIEIVYELSKNIENIGTSSEENS